MTNKELHIGIDLSLKLFNHNLLGRLLPEEKDYILNKVIIDLVHKTAEDARHSVINVETYADITSFYNILEPFLIRRQLEVVNNRERYVECALPKFVDTLDKLGCEIMANTEYKVEQVGNLNTLLTALTAYGLSDNYKENDIFIFEPGLIEASSTLDVYAGVKYKILRADGLDFVQYAGSSSNDVGTVFTAFQDYTFTTTSTGAEAILEVISFIPLVWNGIKLITIKALTMFDYILINTWISTNAFIRLTNNTKLVKGKKYRVSTAGAFTDLMTYGSEYETVEVGYIFTATRDGIPTWDDGSDAGLELLTASTCRLIKPQDISSFLEHSYGTTTTSPLATLGNGNIQIYHDNKFSIINVELVYVRPPAKIDSNTNVETDLNPNLHSRIVTLAVEDIVATQNPQLYQTVNAQAQQQVAPK